MSALTLHASNAPVGASIEGIDLRHPASAEDLSFIRQAIDDHAVVVIRGQQLTPGQQVAFARNFGTLQVNVRAEANNDDEPEIFWVSNINRDGKPVGSHDAGRYWPAHQREKQPGTIRVKIMEPIRTIGRDSKELTTAARSLMAEGQAALARPDAA